MVSDERLISLALCECGHRIARHDAAGCPGAQATFCVCTLTPAAALDAAIERVRADCLRARISGVRKARAPRGHARRRGLDAL